MDEEISIINSNSRNDKIKNFIFDNKNKIISSIIIILIVIVGFDLVESSLSLSFHILEFSLREQLFMKKKAINKTINLFTKISFQSFLCLQPYIWIRVF